VRHWRVEAIRAYLSSVRSDWQLDAEFSVPGRDVWIRKAADGSYVSAQLRHYPAARGKPALAPEVAVIDFCNQLGIEPRLLFEALGAEGQYLGPPP
jgi:hypothetical protein